jgi:type I restriction enzyme S subunit
MNLGALRGLPVVLFPLQQQHAIAHILGTLDDKIELNRRMNETLEAMALALFKSWFVDFDPVRAKAEGRDPGLPKQIADLFPDSFEDSELGDIPKGWGVGTLGMLGELTIGGDWGEDEAFAGAVEASCLRGVDLEHLRQSGHASAPRRWFKPSSLERRAMDNRDVLVAGSGAGPTGRSLWICDDLLQALGPCVYSNFCKRIRCDTAAQAVYLDAWLRGMRASGEIWEHVNGTSVPNLDANSLLAGKEIPLPPVPVLNRHHDFVRPIWQELYAGQNRILAALRDTLLPKLISGELWVQDTERFIGSCA